MNSPPSRAASNSPAASSNATATPSAAGPSRANNASALPDTPQQDKHTRQAARSESVLKAAREEAARLNKYDSAIMRNKIITSFRAAFDGKSPFGWQVDVAEALLLGVDCMVIAGTGAGKTMPFAMPLLVDDSKKKMVIIISPLNELEQDQARRFEAMGLTAKAVNGETYNSQLHKEIAAQKHRVLLTSPEMCLEHEQFSKLMRTPDFMKNVAAVIIDEAHCISQWGDKFRKKFAELGKLRSFVALHVPFLATSATLPPFMLQDVQLKLHFDISSTYFVNLGNNRANIIPAVHRMKAAATALPILDFVVRDATPGSILQKTIIFFNTRDQNYL